MFIKSLIIKNFRCFDAEGITIDFNDGPTALIGRNGSGKTSILEALNYLIGQDYLPSKISEKDFHSEANNIKSEIVIEGETNNPFFITLESLSAETSQVESIAIPCNKIKLTIKRRQKAEKILDDPFIINKVVIPIEGTFSEETYEPMKSSSVRKALTVEKNESYYSVSYKLKNGQERNSTFLDYQLSFNPSKLFYCPKAYYLDKERGRELFGPYSLIGKILTDIHWKYRRNQAKNENIEIDNHYETLAQALRKSVDEKELLTTSLNNKIKEICNDEKKFKVDFIDLEQPYKLAFISQKEGVKCLTPANMGSGFNILIAYALFSHIVELEKVPIALLIDEPELHLHSDWQRRMRDIFSKQADLQIIYSTQSESFISLKNWEQIRLLGEGNIFPTEKSLKEKIKSTKDDKEYEIIKYLQHYSKTNAHVSTILKENLEMFFTKKCIIVEGPGDKYAFSKLLKLSGCDLDDYSVSIIPVWGKTKIKIYQMICRSFGIKYFTIFDKDDETGSEKENVAIESNSINGFVKFSSSLEKILGINNNEDKFQKLVKIIDELQDDNSLNIEIKSALKSVKDFIVS